MTGWATLNDRAEGAELRFERRLEHAPEKVFRAISDPDELRHWFPAAMEAELRPGAPVRFTFEGGDDAPGGEILEVDPPRLLVYSWGDDVLRWEIEPADGGSRLVFTHTLAPGGASGGLPGTARNAAGWDMCLAALHARLDGDPTPEPAWFPLFEGYAERFGLGEGRVTADGVRFERDVVQTPAEVWALLTGGDASASAGGLVTASLGIGEPAPRRFGPEPPGRVVAAEPERALTFAGPAGEVRWTLEPRMPGALVVVEVAQPDGLPAALAAWQVHLELLVAALAGIERCWPDERVAALEARYATRLTAGHFSAAGQAIR